MVDNKVNFDWENLAIKGGLEGQLKAELRTLKKYLINRVIESGESSFLQNSSQLSNEFINSVKPQLDEIFLDFSFSKFLIFLTNSSNFNNYVSFDLYFLIFSFVSAVNSYSSSPMSKDF